MAGGTSAGAPQWAGTTAIANQLAGRPLGFLNNRLYELGKLGLLRTLMHDITVGDNGFAGIPGYAATAGWDLASGWGTPKKGLIVSLIFTPDDDRYDRDGSDRDDDD